MHSAEKDTLYYDSLCPLSCQQANRLREIADEGLELVDIHHLAQDPTLPPRQLLLRRSHLRRNDQTLVTGLNADIAAWQHTRHGWLWRCLNAPIVARVAITLYEWRAHRRYLNLYGKCKRRSGGNRDIAARRQNFFAASSRTHPQGSCMPR